MHFRVPNSAHHKDLFKFSLQWRNSRQWLKATKAAGDKVGNTKAAQIYTIVSSFFILPMRVYDDEKGNSLIELLNSLISVFIFSLVFWVFMYHMYLFSVRYTLREYFFSPISWVFIQLFPTLCRSFSISLVNSWCDFLRHESHFQEVHACSYALKSFLYVYACFRVSGLKWRSLMHSQLIRPLLGLYLRTLS